MCRNPPKALPQNVVDFNSSQYAWRKESKDEAGVFDVVLIDEPKKVSATTLMPKLLAHLAPRIDEQLYRRTVLEREFSSRDNSSRSCVHTAAAWETVEECSCCKGAGTFCSSTFSFPQCYRANYCRPPIFVSIIKNGRGCYPCNQRSSSPSDARVIHRAKHG